MYETPLLGQVDARFGEFFDGPEGTEVGVPRLAWSAGVQVGRERRVRMAWESTHSWAGRKRRRRANPSGDSLTGCELIVSIRPYF